MTIRCLVVGAKGFVGGHLTAALIHAGYAVRVLDRAGLSLLPLPAVDAIEFFDGDFRDSGVARAAMDGCAYCFHLASTTTPKSSNDDLAFDVESNVIGTIRLLEAAKDARIEKFIFASSGGTIYGTPRYTPLDEDHPTEPICSYGITKLTIEKYLRLFRALYGLDYVALRISNAFGEGQRTRSGQGAVAVFLGKCLRGEPVEIWGDGSIVRDYIYVGDIVEACLAAMADASGEHVYNVGSGVPMSLLEMLDSIEIVTGKSVERRFQPTRGFDVPVNVLSINRIREHLGWWPKTGFLDGLARMAAWLQANTEP